MSAVETVKRLFLGRKLASNQLGETLLPKRLALPVFASDALSSVAYAPDEILATLSLAGLAGYAYSWPIAILVCVVMLVVVASYRQTVHAYPNGGGGYEVARHNLGPTAGLIVASALMVDYTLTVAVSVSSGIQNAKAALPFLNGHEALFAAIVILVITTLNLRGVRESGGIFAIPTYAFMIGILGMAGVGLFRLDVLRQPLVAQTTAYDIVAEPAYVPFAGLTALLLVARAFSAGSSALTGVEAISNSVPAFKKPKSKNAATTLLMLGVIAIAMFIGILSLASQLGVKLISEGARYSLDGKIVDLDADTVIGQLAQAVFGDIAPVAFYFVVIATMVILFVAANTAFNGFPVLGSILARDDYLPRQLHTRGDRLAYSNGIIFLALAAIGLVVAYKADVGSMIHLYVVGVFVSFTLSQAGMLKHWNRHLVTATDPRERVHMQRSRAINAVGMVMSAVVLAVVLVSKFTHGAYLAVGAMAVVFLGMRLIRRHYEHVEREIAWAASDGRTNPSRTRAVVLVSHLNKPTVRAISFAKASRPTSLEAVTIAIDPEATARLLDDWDEADFGIPLKVVASPFREVTTPFVDYVRAMKSAGPRDVVVVYVPEYVVGHWWEQPLHNQQTLMIRARLMFVPGVLVMSVPYLLESSAAQKARLDGDHPSLWRATGTVGESAAPLPDTSAPGER